MKIVFAAVVIFAASSSNAQGEPPAVPKAAHLKAAGGHAPDRASFVRATIRSSSASVKLTPYIYKAPMATRPIKTW